MKLQPLLPSGLWAEPAVLVHTQPEHGLVHSAAIRK